MNWHDLLRRFAVMSRLEIAVALLCVLVLLYAMARLRGISQREQRLVSLKRSRARLPRSESKLDLTAVASPPWYDRPEFFPACPGCGA